MRVTTPKILASGNTSISSFNFKLRLLFTAEAVPRFAGDENVEPVQV
jgi:hypothetical protein